jgi:adenine/guanine phosphoribosyltransferase-like PRPP-binding protein
MSALNLLVFRAGQRHVRGHDLKAALIMRLESLADRPSQDVLLAALLLAGELECGVADAAYAAHADAVHQVELLTDGIAEAILRTATPPSIQSLREVARAAPVCEQLRISVPEGFAYYALDPLAYARALNRILADAGSVLVVGIRSIGVTLSAIAAAAARLHGMKARRITVRPEEHPYNRRTEFSRAQLAVVQQAVSSGATFVVVDEGPGLSGSSFLSVAEALERAGAPGEKIILLGGHEPNVDALCATDAARRWRRFRYHAVAGEPRRPASAVDFIGAGEWRSRVLHNEADWPASWTSFERLKYLSPAANHGKRLFKFAGLGHYGDPVFAREQTAAKRGFGPPVCQENDGFVSYPWLEGSRLADCNLSRSILARLVEYCAFRRRAFPVELPDLNALQQMAEHNLNELKLDLPVALRLEHPVIADGRMQPHEWLLTREGRLLKTDSGSHGDDHFFPGATDIAWDLAGAMVEWRMNQDQATVFLDLYRRASGDDASRRIDGFVTAYAAFRCAYSMMAANAMHGTEEQPRLERAADGYRSLLTAMTSSSVVAL